MDNTAPRAVRRGAGEMTERDGGHAALRATEAAPRWDQDGVGLVARPQGCGAGGP